MSTERLQNKIKVAGHLEPVRDIYQMCMSWKNPDGSKGRKSKSTGLRTKGNKKKADDMLSAFKKELEQELNAQVQKSNNPNQALSASPILFADFMQSWLTVAKNSGIEKTTYGGYWANVNNYIDPYFRKNGKRVHDLTADDINEFYSDMYLAGLCANSVLKFHNNISKAKNQKGKRKLFANLEWEDVDRPTPAAFRAKFLKQADAVRLFDAVKGHKLELPVVLAAFYGFRRGEVVGMKWDAIDFDANTISVAHTVTTFNDEGKFGILQKDTAKSSASLRTLPLIPMIRSLLLQKWSEQQEYKKLCGNCYCYDHDGYVCVDKLGKLYKPNYLSAAFPKFCEKNGFQRMRFHDLRHSSASLLLSSGVPMKQVQLWLGHAHYSTTADLYSHLDFEDKIAAANAMTWVNSTHLAQLESEGKDKEKLTA